MYPYQSSSITRTNLLYSTEGELTLFDRTILGTSPVGTIVSLLIVENLPHTKKNLLNVCITHSVLSSFFKSIGNRDSTSSHLSFYSMRTSGWFFK